jgi:hypothetical protein
MTQLRRAEARKNARFPDRISERLQPLIELGGAKKDAHSRMNPSGYSASSAEIRFGKPNASFCRGRSNKVRAERSSEYCIEVCLAS